MGELQTSAIYNRLQKNMRKLKPWALKIPTDAYRIYDKDIPEYPSQIDLYGQYVVLHDRRDAYKDVGPVKEKNFQDTIASILELVGIPLENLIIKERKTHAHKSGGESIQYEKNKNTSVTDIIVQEGRAKFKINLTDYIDVGLFLDHRPLRLRFGKDGSEFANGALLNLFCYTASVSVTAALSGMKTVNVDLSNTYLEWSRENFKLNGIDPSKHEFLNRDALEFLEHESRQNSPQKFDVIFCDPPTFSNSKKMNRDSFEIQRDQEFLVDHCMRLLAPAGTLYFSNNRRDFKLSDRVKNDYMVDDETAWSLPSDFRDPKTHHLFLICHK